MLPVMDVYFCLILFWILVATMGLDLVSFYPRFQIQSLNLASICPLLLMAHITLLCPVVLEQALPVKSKFATQYTGV